MSKFALASRAVALLVLGFATSFTSQAQTLTTLHSFNGADGAQPYAPLLQGSDGNLYGTTYNGGTASSGTVFKITTEGALTTLHNFNRALLQDGREPAGGLIQTSNGNLYGTTALGGLGRVGTIYVITPSGTFSVFQSFIYAQDGANVQSALFRASNGNFYGTAAAGGGGAGTVFEATSFRQLTGIYDFGTQGSSPVGGVVQAGDGKLYGTTGTGGAQSCGTLFSITLQGQFTSLMSLTGTDGCNPAATLLLGSDGALYGTTETGGAHNGFNAGVAFKYTVNGTLTVLHVFQISDGAFPSGALIEGSDGNFYGTTQVGGAHGKGTIFKMTPLGTVTTLYSFCSQGGCSDGAMPIAGLIQANDGKFYGTTSEGGISNNGTVFSFATAQ